MNVGAIVLAAGQSSRMGKQKLLLPYGAVTVIEHIVSQLENCRIDPVLVVVGKNGKRIEGVLQNHRIEIVYNQLHSHEMLSSVRCGLRALPKECEAALIVLGDQPSIQTNTVKQILQTRSDTHAEIIVPTFENKRGHPLLISRKYQEEIEHNYESEGLRGLLVSHSSDVLERSINDPSVLRNMNTPEDYARELKLAGISKPDAAP